MSADFCMEKISPRIFEKRGKGYFADFGLDAFGAPELTLSSPEGGEKVEILLGEKYDFLRERIDRSTQPYCTLKKVEIILKKGRHTYRPEISRSSGLLSSPTGFEVIPFRYCEITGAPCEVRKEDLFQLAVFGNVDLHKASFTSSLPDLDKVWELCHYTMKATTLFGYFIDGERERLPYEGDSYITSLSYYACENRYEIAKRTLDYLMKTPTWPTEYMLLMVPLYWDYYMYSGDLAELKKRYETLKEKLLLFYAIDDVLLNVRKVHEHYTDEELHDKTGLPLYFAHWARDLVEWPPSQRDNYDFGPVTTGLEDKDPRREKYWNGVEIAGINFVPNAFHKWALDTMEKIALELGDKEYAAFCRQRSQAVAKRVCETMYLPEEHRFVDSPAATRTSFMTDVMSVYAGMAKEEDHPFIAKRLIEKGMACGVYGAQFLLSVLFRLGYAAEAITLMADPTSPRSWSNMLRRGATITMETWDDYEVKGRDWNHAWGTAPLNVIPREMFGIKPLSPGFKTFSLKPDMGFLDHAAITQPTLQGVISVSLRREGEEKGILEVTVPAGTECFCTFGGKSHILEPGTHTLEGFIPMPE